MPAWGKLSILLPCRRTVLKAAPTYFDHSRPFEGITRKVHKQSGPNASGHSSNPPLLQCKSLLDGRVMKVTLADPRRRNALSLKMMDSLCGELKRLDADPRMRAVIIAGEGPAFSAGHDLREFVDEKNTERMASKVPAEQSQSARNNKVIFAKCTELMETIQRMQLPVIAEVDGVAAAAGCQLVAQCDIAVASEKTRFSVPGLRVGLFCSTPAIPLARCVPRKLAMDMLLTARSITAQEALQAGLISRIAFAPNTAESESLKVVDEVMKMSREVIALGKAFFYAQVELGINQAYREGERVMCSNLNLYDANEGIHAFMGKRQPTWKQEIALDDGRSGQ